MSPSQRHITVLFFLLCAAVFTAAGLSDTGAASATSPAPMLLAQARQLYGTQSSDPRALLPSARDQLNANRGRQLNSIQNRQLDDRLERRLHQEQMHNNASNCGTANGPACPEPRLSNQDKKDRPQ